MTSYAAANAGKLVVSNMTCERTQQHTEYSVFQFARVTLCDVMLCNFPNFVGPNGILDGTANGLSICQ